MIEKDVGMHGTGETPLNGKLEFEPGLSHWLVSPTDRKKLRSKWIRASNSETMSSSYDYEQ